MTPKSHEHLRSLIDQALLDGNFSPPDSALDQHLLACQSCRDYLEISMRAVASLNSFSFEIDPALERRVVLALQAQQARPPQPTPLSRRRLILASAIALFLTLAGSLLDLRLAHLAAPLFHLSAAGLQSSLLSLWILPSLLLLLLFPLLPLLSMPQERSL